ncbi:tetratricopeptide repeat protein [Pseudanabaena sp. 'Roaring Creek']|uniref:tetratricopeptide repeat protein n=1 Tax=Pseudanabaena sp. 'Roaring Creek' TaxID=1681830 RepID=UPI0006D783BD|nr:tetratricopeptide repeat protein [Pseudanabaena sp. 'Roaring Creek']
MVTRIFLCNEQTEPEIRDFIREAIADISEGEQYIVTWNCGNIQTLKVGDRAYFKRIGSANQGYFASGTVVPADREYQLKLRSARYRELSEAYDIDSQVNNFRIWVAWDACVSFDEPLRTDYLRQLPHFQGMPLEPQTDAGVFREEYVRMLDREWERQTQKAFRAGKGISLVDVYYRWGLEDIQQGFPQDALESFRQALKLNPNFIKAYLGLGDAHVSLREYAKAVGDYGKAISMRPDKARLAYFKRGEINFLLGQLQQAMADFEAAIAIDPSYADAHMSLGNTYFKLRSYEQAIACFSRTLELSPERDLAVFRRGRAHYILKEFPEAIRDFSHAIELQPSNVDAYYYRGLTYSQPDIADETLAGDDLRKAIVLYQTQGKPDKAKKAKEFLETLAIDSLPKAKPRSNYAIAPAATSIPEADAPITVEPVIAKKIVSDDEETSDLIIELPPQTQPTAIPVENSAAPEEAIAVFSSSELIASPPPETIERIVEVEKIVEKLIEVEKLVEVEKIVEIEKIVEVEKLVEVEKIIEVERVVDRVVDRIVDRIVEKPIPFSIEDPSTAEKLAMISVMAQYMRDGWMVRSVDKSQVGYDLECTKDNRCEAVVIKSFTSDRDSFAISAIEIENARSNKDFVLWVVSGAAENPELRCLRGRELFEQFDLDPLAFAAKVRQAAVQLEFAPVSLEMPQFE